MNLVQNVVWCLQEDKIFEAPSIRKIDPALVKSVDPAVVSAATKQLLYSSLKTIVTRKIVTEDFVDC